jgi:TonB dependent receptor
MKIGGEFRRTGLDMFQAIAPNAFYVFASTFPTNNAMANLLLGAPVTFYQGLGDFNRGLRMWSLGSYAQDEWRLGSRVTFNYGLRYERINPITEIEDRLTGFIPACSPVSGPMPPKGSCSPATLASAVASRRAPMPSCRVSGLRGIQLEPGRGRFDQAMASFMTSFRMAPEPRRRCP